ncbi:MAG: hypothetical protein NZM18_08635 [Thermoflexales bacterium]|nr:hypothetical protein [Thermoflexales bacterium]MDW8351531.1 hypothetical protein [Anaerolineae bacterium]
MATGSVELRPRSTGEIFSLTFSLYRKYFLLFISITSVVLLPILLLNGALSVGAALIGVTTPIAASGRPLDALTQDFSFSALLSVPNCLSALVWLLGVLWPWTEGALTFNVIERVLGRAPGLRASYGQTLKRWGALWIANFLAQLGIILPLLVVVYPAIFGGLALAFAVPVFGVFGADVLGNIPPVAFAAALAVCVPAVVGAVVISVVLAINWAFRTPAIVGEGVDGLRGLSRSMAIARGNRRLIFWRYALLLVLEFILSAAPALLASAIMLVVAFTSLPTNASGGSNLDDTPLLTTAVIIVAIATAMSGIGTLLFAPFRVVFTTLNYLDLRIRKENLAALLAAPQPSGAPTASLASAAAAPSAPHAARPGMNWRDVDLAKMTPGQRVGVLFNRLRVEGESAQTLKEMALALKEVGDWGGALDSLMRARAIAPSDPSIAYNLMLLYRERRDMTAARRMMQEYLRLETDPNALAAVRSNPRFEELLSE